MFTKSLVSLVLIAASAQTAVAADWQYCLAPSYAEHKVYIPGSFLARDGLGNADSAFEQMLGNAGLRHDGVQCPRADDESSIVIMRQYAIRFNQDRGNVIIHMPLNNTR